MRREKIEEVLGEVAFFRGYANEVLKDWDKEHNGSERRERTIKALKSISLNLSKALVSMRKDNK